MARSARVLFFFMIMVCRSCCVSPTSSHHHHPDDELHTHYYTQTIDHFTYLPQSYLTFPQRYLISSKHWGGDGFPILVYLGGEDGVAPAFIEKSVGFLAEHAPHLKAMKVYIEHRYYGNSLPFGSLPEAVKNASTLGYLNSAQALADYAEVILSLKKNLSAESSPVIVVGGSYSGSLAAWFRLKYPHIAHGAVASSVSIFYDETESDHGFNWVISEDFRRTSQSCYNVIKQSWSEIDRIASKPNGLPYLSRAFKTCVPLKKASELKNYLIRMYLGAAQYNNPPEYPVNKVCDAIDGARNGSSILKRIYAGTIAYNERNPLGCNPTFGDEVYKKLTPYGWQVCTEQRNPIWYYGNNTMFPASSSRSDVDKFRATLCQNKVGVSPRPHWLSTEFGGTEIKKALKMFASNIIFYNGLQDPWSTGGVLKNISNTLIALTTPHGAHCADLNPKSPNDPAWLVNLRQKEIKIVKGWLKQYGRNV